MCGYVDDYLTFVTLEKMSKTTQKQVISIMGKIDDTELLTMIHQYIVSNCDELIDTVVYIVIHHHLSKHSYHNKEYLLCNDRNCYDEYQEIDIEGFLNEYQKFKELFIKINKEHLLDKNVVFYDEFIGKYYSKCFAYLIEFDRFDKIIFHNESGFNSDSRCTRDDEANFKHDSSKCEYSSDEDSDNEDHVCPNCNFYYRPYTDTYIIEKKNRSITINEFIEAIYKVKSSQYDTWYELYCNCGLEISDKCLQINLRFDHGS